VDFRTEQGIRIVAKVTEELRNRKETLGLRTSQLATPLGIH